MSGTEEELESIKSFEEDDNYTLSYKKPTPAEEFRDTVLEWLFTLFLLCIVYAITHSHQSETDCWWCKYRGIIAMGGFLVLKSEYWIKEKWEKIWNNLFLKKTN